MDKRPIEPGLIRIFRYFTGVAMLYFAVLIIYTAIETGEGFTASQIQSYMNFGTNLVLFSNLIYLTEPRSKDLALIITSSWLLLPILLVPLVLIAWQYRFRYVILFILFTTLVELSVLLLPVVHRIDFETLPILGVPFIRAFAFGTVGHIVVHLIDTQRAQRRELVRANIRLSKHAQTLEQLTVIRERNRLARELHDTLAHTLSGQAVNLEAIKTMIPPERTDIHEMLDHSLNNIRAGLAETRRALKALRSATLEDFGLAISIRNLATDAATRGDLRLNLAIDENIPDLTPDVEQCFYRIAQRMVIQDNGEGFDLREAELDDKLGIQGMQERAEMVHGKLTFNSAPGKGTNIELIVGVGDD